VAEVTGGEVTGGEVAVLGTGRMGAAMARRLAAAGHRVRVWNRTPAAALAVARQVAADGLDAPPVRVAPGPAGAVAGAGYVLCALADGGATGAVLLDPLVLAAIGPDTVVCDLGTSGVAAARELHAALRTAGRVFVDAPVSGSVATVLAGQLLVMAGGDEAAVAALRPVLSAFAKAVVRVGAAGTGQAMKLAVNLVVHDLNAALSEALVLAGRAGIEPAAAYDILAASVVGAPYVRYKRAAFLDDTTPVAMTLDLVGKDLGLITELAAGLAVPLPATGAVAGVVAAARAAGYGPRDMAALRHHLDDLAG